MRSQWSASVAGALAMALSAPQAHATACSELVVGAALSLTGIYATNGIHTKNGYTFAINKLKERGSLRIGQRCYNFRVIYFDDESDPERAAKLAERLIQQDKVQYLLGPYSSRLTEAVASVAERHEVPLVVSQGAARSLYRKGRKYLFAVLSTSEQYLTSTIALAAGVAKSRGKDPATVKLAIAVEDDPFSRDIRAGVLSDAKQFGMSAIIDKKLPRDLADMSAILNDVKAKKPDILIVSGHSKGAATAVRQIGEMGIDVPMIAITHCEAADVTGKYARAASGILCATQWSETIGYKDALFGSAANFNKEFRDAFQEYADKQVPYQVAQASASVYVLADAFRRAGSLDKEKVRDALAKTDLMTFYGRVRFSSAGNNVAKPMLLRQIQDGRYVVVAPLKLAARPLVWPRKAPPPQ